MKAINLEPLSNKYADEIKEMSGQREVLLEKLKTSAQRMKDTITQIQIGDDSKVDEAIMISFFFALFDDLTKVYEAIMQNKYQNELERINTMLTSEPEVNGVRLKQELDTFHKQPEKFYEYNRLNIVKSALEKKLSNSDIASAEKKNLEMEYEKTFDNIDKIANFYGFDNTIDFIKELEKYEKKWYGEGANSLKELRSLSKQVLLDIEAAGLTLETIINNVDDGVKFVQDYTKTIVSNYKAILVERLACQFDVNENEKLENLHQKVLL